MVWIDSYIYTYTYGCYYNSQFNSLNLILISNPDPKSNPILNFNPIPNPIFVARKEDLDRQLEIMQEKFKVLLNTILKRTIQKLLICICMKVNTYIYGCMYIDV